MCCGERQEKERSPVNPPSIMERERGGRRLADNNSKKKLKNGQRVIQQGVYYVTKEQNEGQGAQPP